MRTATGAFTGRARRPFTGRALMPQGREVARRVAERLRRDADVATPADLREMAAQLEEWA